jgi:hypothetical protein
MNRFLILLVSCICCLAETIPANAQNPESERVAGSGRVVPASDLVENVKVWVNRSSGVYHCPGTRYYGNTKRGEFVPEIEARKQGNRPAYGKTCGDSLQGPFDENALSPSPLVSTEANTQIESSSAKVWVNQSSHVYHCPGTRYYGATKRGQFMSERDAIASGNRPAYGRRCS